MKQFKRSYRASRITLQTFRARMEDKIRGRGKVATRAYRDEKTVFLFGMEIRTRCLYSVLPLSLRFSPCPSPSPTSPSVALLRPLDTQVHPLKVSQMISNITVKLSRRLEQFHSCPSCHAHFSSCFSCRAVSERAGNFSPAVLPGAT